MIFEQFQAYCKAKNIRLLPHQARLAEHLLSKENDVKILSGVLSGKTFLFNTIENFLKTGGIPVHTVHSSDD